LLPQAEACLADAIPRVLLVGPRDTHCAGPSDAASRRR
jgi:hypothetical protein